MGSVWYDGSSVWYDGVVWSLHRGFCVVFLVLCGIISELVILSTRGFMSVWPGVFQWELIYLFDYSALFTENLLMGFVF